MLSVREAPSVGGDSFWMLLSESSTSFPLLAHKNQMLLVRQDALLVLDFGSDVLYGVTGLHLKGGGLACQGLHTDLHLCVLVERKSGIMLLKSHC